MESVVSTLFLSFNTGKSADHAKDKSYAILTQILLQRKSAFSALAKRVALAFVQMAELHPLDSSELFLEKHKKTTKTRKTSTAKARFSPSDL